MRDPVTSPELEHLKRLFLTFPCSIRLKRRIAEEKTRLRRQEAQELRRRIRRSIMSADVDTLALVARQLGVAS